MSIFITIMKWNCCGSGRRRIRFLRELTISAKRKPENNSDKQNRTKQTNKSGLTSSVVQAFFWQLLNLLASLRWPFTKKMFRLS